MSKLSSNYINDLVENLEIYVYDKLQVKLKNYSSIGFFISIVYNYSYV